MNVISKTVSGVVMADGVGQDLVEGDECWFRDFSDVDMIFVNKHGYESKGKKLYNVWLYYRPDIMVQTQILKENLQGMASGGPIWTVNNKKPYIPSGDFRCNT